VITVIALETSGAFVTRIHGIGNPAKLPDAG
jgi:hypothetical protein